MVTAGSCCSGIPRQGELQEGDSVLRQVLEIMGLS